MGGAWAVHWDIGVKCAFECVRDFSGFCVLEVGMVGFGTGVLGLELGCWFWNWGVEFGIKVLGFGIITLFFGNLNKNNKNIDYSYVVLSYIQLLTVPNSRFFLIKILYNFFNNNSNFNFKKSIYIRNLLVKFILH